MAKWPVGGLALTLILAVLSALTSAVIGITLGIALSLSRGWTRRGLRIVLGFFRAIPVLMLIFWSYFLLPILTGFRPPEIATVVAALSLIGGSYLAEPFPRALMALRKASGRQVMHWDCAGSRSSGSSFFRKRCGPWCPHSSINGQRSSRIPRLPTLSACRNFRSLLRRSTTAPWSIRQRSSVHRRSLLGPLCRNGSSRNASRRTGQTTERS